MPLFSDWEKVSARHGSSLSSWRGHPRRRPRLRTPPLRPPRPLPCTRRRPPHRAPTRAPTPTPRPLTSTSASSSTCSSCRTLRHGDHRKDAVAHHHPRLVEWLTRPRPSETLAMHEQYPCKDAYTHTLAASASAAAWARRDAALEQLQRVAWAVDVGRRHRRRDVGRRHRRRQRRPAASRLGRDRAARR